MGGLLQGRGTWEMRKARPVVDQSFKIFTYVARENVTQFNVLGKAQSKGKTGKKETAKLGAGAALSLTVSQPRNRR